MSWTCDQIEARLSDYLDGQITAPERMEYEAHLKSCPQCAPLVASVRELMGEMHAMAPIEAPPRLIYAILDKTLGPREQVTGWQAVLQFLQGLASPKFAYGAASVMATFIILLGASGFSLKKTTMADLKPAAVYRRVDREVHLRYAQSVKYVSDLRVVYEIQSRLRNDDNNSLQSAPDESLPKNAPEKSPGQTDGNKPAGPRQQNRANELARQVEVLAAMVPVTWERSLR